MRPKECDCIGNPPKGGTYSEGGGQPEVREVFEQLRGDDFLPYPGAWDYFLCWRRAWRRKRSTWWRARPIRKCLRAYASTWDGIRNEYMRTSAPRFSLSRDVEGAEVEVFTGAQRFVEGKTSGNNLRNA
jgi:hypothetical protein